MKAYFGIVKDMLQETSISDQLYDQFDCKIKEVLKDQVPCDCCNNPIDRVFFEVDHPDFEKDQVYYAIIDMNTEVTQISEEKAIWNTNPKFIKFEKLRGNNGLPMTIQNNRVVEFIPKENFTNAEF